MLSILGVGQSHPATVIDNAFLESLDIGTNNEWIMERVGIKTRRTVLPLDYIRQTRNQDVRAATEAAQETLTSLGVKAAQMAIQRAGIKAEEIGLVMAGTCVPQMNVPPLACLIAADLGIKAAAFDLNSACSTSSAQIHFVNSMKFDQLPDYVLIVQSEAITTVTNFNDRNTAVLFGDGAAAMVLSPRHKGKAQIVTSLFESDPSSWAKVVIPRYDHIFQEGSAVQRFAILQTVSTYEKLIEKMGKKIDPYFIGHQANLMMLKSSCDRMGIVKDKHFYNIDIYGNCGGCGGPTVLADNWDTFKNGDYLALVTVGAGLSWGGAIILFGDNK